MEKEIILRQQCCNNSMTGSQPSPEKEERGRMSMFHLFNRRRRSCGFISLCCIILFLWGGRQAQAQLGAPLTLTHDISGGALTITQADNGYNFLVTGRHNVNNANSPAIVIKNGYTGAVTLKDVYISVNSASGSAMVIENGANVTLKLMGADTLIRPQNIGNTSAILRIEKDAYLTIESYNGKHEDGKLYVRQDDRVSGAAIGSNKGTTPSGHLTINSGTVYAVGGDDGAAIGGGDQSAGGYITINGGNVTAICDSRAGSANSGAGIGSGYNCNSNETYIRINGGTVTAVSLISNSSAANGGGTVYDLCGSAIGAGNRSATNSNQGGFGYIILAGGKIRASVRGWFDNADPCKVSGQCTANGGYYGHNDPAGSLHGRDGVAIGGGANPNAQGTIIVLPSADISEVYGGKYYGKNTANGWDIGNCQKIFYLNKRDLRVAVGNATVQKTKVFTARTNPALPGVDILADIQIANQHLPAVASKTGITGVLDSIVGAASGSGALYYYTNSAVTFFTQAKNGNSPFKLYTAAATPFNDLNTGEKYNPGSNVYNVILNAENNNPSYGIKLSDGYVPPATPTPPGATKESDITLDFGEATYKRTGIIAAGNFKQKMAFQILNAGKEWLDIKMDTSSTVESFVLEGPVVSPPEVKDGAHLPVGKAGEIIATVKPRISVGDHKEKLVLKGFKANGDSIVRTIILKIKVNQELVSSDSSASLTAIRPAPPASSADTTKTNAAKVTLKARADATDIDGVKTVWYLFSDSPNLPTFNGGAVGTVPGNATGWKKDTVQPTANRKYSYSFTFKPDFPNKDTVYYIHWYMETVNTIGSRGTISSYDVRRKRPKPTITKTDGILSIGSAPFEIAVKFDPAFDPTLTSFNENMVTVQGGAVVHNSVNTVIPGKEYRLRVKSAGANNVEIRFPENQVTDAYNNRNVPANLSLPYNTGLPRADFSSYMDSVYFGNQASVKFRVSSGNPDPRLYRNDGRLLVNPAALLVKVTKDGSPFSLANVDFNGTNNINEFTLTGAFAPGEYRIRIAADSITNYAGNGIADTTYTFKVFRLGLSFGGTLDFGRLHEGYAPVAPRSITVTNSSGSVGAAGLHVGVTGSDFAVHTGGMTPNLSGNATTSFTVAPKTGLRVNPSTARDTVFTAKVILRYHNRPDTVAAFNVKFTVFKLQAPTAKIDYVNETLTSLSPDRIYSINRETAIAATDSGTVPISENWMNDQTSTNEEVDSITGGRSIPQPILIPQRPAAPKSISRQDVSDVGRNNGEIRGVNDRMEYRRMMLRNNDRMEYRRMMLRNEAWIPVPAGERTLWDLPPGRYQIRYKAVVDQAFASHIFEISIREWSVPRIKREITLPEIQGITMNPLPGRHYVASGDDFTFTLTGTEAPPTVKTGRIINGVQEELTGVPDGYSSYIYVIRQVREALSVTIESGTVGHASVEGRAVWTTPGHICIRTLQAEPVDIYTVTGVLFRHINATDAATISVPAAKGVYLIRFTNSEVYKVIVR